jgi:hypothetical protein
LASFALVMSLGQILGEDLAEGVLGAARGWAVVVGQVEVRDAEVEGPAGHGAAVLERVHAAEVVPEPERDGGQLDATPAAASVEHGVGALVGG